jgi:hypothetical protein
MKLLSVPVTIIFLLHHCGVGSLENYYWREYVGRVPEDAIVAGKTAADKNVYIGQGYLKNAGLIVGSIYPGVKEVHVPYAGDKKLDKYVKILCGPQENFYWMLANYTNLHLKVIDKHAVIGGHQDADGYMNIGRISHGGDIIVGKISSFWPGKAHFYFIDNGSEKYVDSYQVLMYNGDDVAIDPRIKK